MRLSRSQKLSLAVLLTLAALVVWLALRNPQPPLLPADPDHADDVGEATCLHCHDADGVFPRSANHPLGQDCRRCHGAF